MSRAQKIVIIGTLAAVVIYVVWVLFKLPLWPLLVMGVVAGGLYVISTKMDLLNNLVNKTKKELSTKTDEDGVGEFDSSVKRNRAIRILFFFGSMAAFLFVPGLLMYTIVSIPFGPPKWWFIPIMLTGMLIGGEIFARYIANYFISVPLFQGFVTNNSLKSTFSFLGKFLHGKISVIYGPGLHFAFPWEQRKKKNNFSTEVFTLLWEEKVPGEDAELHVTGSYQFEVDLRRSERFIGIDEETIRTGGIDLIKAFVSNRLAGKKANEAKAGIETLNEDLNKEFGVDKSKKNVSADDSENLKKISAFEDRYGINSKAVTVSGIDLPEDVQKTRNAIDESRQAFIGVAARIGLTETELRQKLSDKEMSIETFIELSDRFAVENDSATMTVNALKIHGLGDLTKGLETALLALNKKGG